MHIGGYAAARAERRYRSQPGRTLGSVQTNAQQRDEHHYGEIDVVLLQIDAVVRRIDKAAAELRGSGADELLLKALEQTREELAESSKKLTQGTLFAVPKEQLTL